MGISRDTRHKRRATGGKRKAYRKKRKFEMGRPPANTKLGEKRVHLVRTRGGNKKYRALRLETGNFSWGSEAVSRKSRIISVVYNASNNELVRTNTLVKNCIIQVDAAPFRLYYEQYYGVAPGSKRRVSDKRPSKKSKRDDKKAAKGAAKGAKAPAKDAKGAAKAPAKSAKAPAKDAKGAAKAPAKGVKAPAKAPVKGAKAPAKAPAKASAKAPAKSAKAPAKVAKAPAKDAKAPAKASAKAPAKSAKAPAKDAKPAKVPKEKDAKPAKAPAKVAKDGEAPKKEAGKPKKSNKAIKAAEARKILLATRKIQSAHRKATGKAAENLVAQFATGRLLVCVSSRPGQSGRCDGYVLEGKELDFYQKKIAAKKKAK